MKNNEHHIEAETQVEVLKSGKDGHVFFHPMSSSISDMMLREMADKCKRYLTDIYHQITWMDNEVEKLLNGELSNVIHIIGFRENGVDGNAFVICKTPNDDEYKSLWTYTAKLKKYDWGGVYLEEEYGKVTTDEAVEFIGKYFDSETYKLKEEYR